jgi:integrase
VLRPRPRRSARQWALTIDQATALAAQSPWLLPRALVGLALLTGLRRGELFALRWWDIDEPNRSLQVRAAVYEGGSTIRRRRPVCGPSLPNAALELLAVWKGRARRTAAPELIFSTVSGKPISPNNVLRRWVWPACPIG